MLALMPTGESIQPYAVPVDAAANERRRVKTFWWWFVVSPCIYFGFAWVADAIDPRWGKPGGNWMAVALAVLALVGWALPFVCACRIKRKPLPGQIGRGPALLIAIGYAFAYLIAATLVER